jgi:hypothetical protein
MRALRDENIAAIRALVPADQITQFDANVLAVKSKG